METSGSPPSLGTVTYCGERATVCEDGKRVRDCTSGATFDTSTKWMAMAGQTLPPPAPVVHDQCVYGCGFTASWGLGGCAPGCAGTKNMCFKCFTTNHTEEEVAEAKLRNDIHLCGPYGQYACPPCHAAGYPLGQHYTDPHDRTEGWSATTYCLENLIGYKAAHGLPGVGHAKGTYTVAKALLPLGHFVLDEAEGLIAALSGSSGGSSGDGDDGGEGDGEGNGEAGGEDYDEAVEVEIEKMIRLATEAGIVGLSGRGDQEEAAVVVVEPASVTIHDEALARSLAPSPLKKATADTSTANIAVVSDDPLVIQFTEWLAKVDAELIPLNAGMVAAQEAGAEIDAGWQRIHGERRNELVVERKMLAAEIAHAVADALPSDATPAESARVTCICGTCALEFKHRVPLRRLLCGCVDCHQAQEWGASKGGPALPPSPILDLLYFENEFIVLSGQECLGFFKLRESGVSTRCVALCCHSTLVVDHPSYEGKAVMVPADACLIVNVEPKVVDARCSLGDLTPEARLSLPKWSGVVFSERSEQAAVGELRKREEWRAALDSVHTSGAFQRLHTSEMFGGKTTVLGLVEGDAVV